MASWVLTFMQVTGLLYATYRIQRVLHSILSARMLLHLRQEAEALREMAQDSAILMHII